MKRLLILIVVCSSFVSCAHFRSDTCDSYCIRNGGTCDYVEHGRRRYNTDNGEYNQTPTYFNCKFFN